MCAMFAPKSAASLRGHSGGDATNTSGAVAVVEPFSLATLRFRGIRCWFAGIGIATLVVVSIDPIASWFRLPAYKAPLPTLIVPQPSLPLLKVPKLHALAPLPTPRSSSGPAAASAASASSIIPAAKPVVHAKKRVAHNVVRRV